MSAAIDIREVRRRLGIAVGRPVVDRREITSRIIYAVPIGPQRPKPAPKREEIRQRDLLDIATRKAGGMFDCMPPMGHEARAIICEVLLKHNMRWLWIESLRRSSELIACRREIVFRLRNELGLTTTRIGAIMNRDHSSIVNLLLKKPRPYIQLTREAVLEIRAAKTNFQEIAKKYGVNDRYILAVRKGERYGFVE